MEILVSERGIVGIGALWLMVAAASIALSVLSMAKWNQARSRNQANDVKMVYLAVSAALIQRDNDFVSAVGDHEFSTGRVITSRIVKEPGQHILLTCEARCKKSEKTFEMDWQRVGGQWRAITWREL
jgi:hypothetical protein